MTRGYFSGSVVVIMFLWSLNGGPLPICFRFSYVVTNEANNVLSIAEKMVVRY